MTPETTPQPGAPVAFPEQQLPQLPNTEVVSTHTQSIRDVSGITGTGSTAETARLISQFGIPTVMIAVFLGIFVSCLWFVRVDFNQQDKERTEAHERSIKGTNEAHERSIKGINETYQKIHSERREDDKERSRDLRDSQSKLWQELRSIAETAKAGNGTLVEAAKTMSATAAELKKISKYIE